MIVLNFLACVEPSPSPPVTSDPSTSDSTTDSPPTPTGPTDTAGTGDTGATVTTDPPVTTPPVTGVHLDPATCCDFQYTDADCPTLGIGSFTVTNATPSTAGELDVSCDIVAGAFPIRWSVAGIEPVAFLVNLPVLAGTTVTVEGFFVCEAPVTGTTFDADCRATLDVGGQQDQELFQVHAEAL